MKQWACAAGLLPAGLNGVGENTLLRGKVIDTGEVVMSVSSTLVTAIIHFILTLVFVLALALGWVWLVRWRFDVPGSITDEEIDADLHFH
ncbi:hypothetical protein [Ferrimonas futtsuensis]|uniref:hypothetical protein n=1 Tax=Ferrimonas futtsuensis TaxID=364764 RepID=UPI000414272B|nr:hypothetical protein [Ferrimonas futtsuensis]